MITKRTLASGLAGTALAAGSLLGFAGIASASHAPHVSHFAKDQQKLETELSARSAQLVRLAADVSGSKSLTSAHASLLSSRIATATANIQALIAKVPNDTTEAQLRADRTSMLANNRVFAVLTPQVFETIEADAISVTIAADQADEAGLQGSVNALLGEHGYQNASRHFVDYVRLVNRAAADTNNVVTSVLAETPADYPGDTHVFTHANHQLLDAQIALAHASYDATVIGLASGGYTGS